MQIFAPVFFFLFETSLAFFLRNRVYISQKSLMVYNPTLTKPSLKQKKSTFEPLQASPGRLG